MCVAVCALPPRLTGSHCFRSVEALITSPVLLCTACMHHSQQGRRLSASPPPRLVQLGMKAALPSTPWAAPSTRLKAQAAAGPQGVSAMCKPHARARGEG